MCRPSTANSVSWARTWANPSARALGSMLRAGLFPPAFQTIFHFANFAANLRKKSAKKRYPLLFVNGLPTVTSCAADVREEALAAALHAEERHDRDWPAAASGIARCQDMRVIRMSDTRMSKGKGFNGRSEVIIQRFTRCLESIKSKRTTSPR